MRAWETFLAASAVLGLVAAGCRGKGRPKDIGPTREVRNNGLAVRIAGPIPLEAPDPTYTGFMTAENLGDTGVYVSVDGCNVALEPGERRGCYASAIPGNPDGPLIKSELTRLPITLKDPTIERSEHGRAHFRAFVVNHPYEDRVAIGTLLEVVDEQNRIVGALAPVPVQSSLAPGEESLIEGDVLLAKGATGKLSLFNTFTYGSRRTMKKEVNPLTAKLTDLKLQSSTKNKQLAATLTNTSSAPIAPDVRFYFKDRKNRAIGTGHCTDTVRQTAPLPLAPNESTPCTANVTAIPQYDHLEIEASVLSWMPNGPAAFTPLAVKEVKLENGIIRVAVQNPAPKMAFYIRAKPDWLYIDYANDQTPYEYRLDGATSAEVTAFAVGGPPNPDWVPIRHWGKSD